MASLYLSVFLLLSIISTSFSLPRLHKRDAQDDAYWNDKVDSLVRRMAQDLLQKEGDSIDVGNLTETFGGFLLNGKLTASGGSVGNFSTLNFVDISVSNTQDSLTVFILVKLDHLEVLYSSFDAHIRFLSASGSLKAEVGDNLLTAQVTLKLDDDSCEASLDVLKFLRFEDIEVAVTGVGYIIESVLNKVANIVVNIFAPQIKPMAEEKLRELTLPYVSLACDYYKESQTSL